MEQQYILTLEELSFSLAYCGYDGMAAGMLRENLGDISEESWEMVLQTAARSLHSKGILLNLNEDDLDHSFVEGFKDLLDDMASSAYMIRCYNENENGQFVLTVHQGKNGLVYNLVSNQIIHILNYINSERLKEELTAFFQPNFNLSANHLSFSCNEEDFHLLNESLENDEDFNSIIHSGRLLGENSLGLETYVQDYKQQQGNYLNISLIKTEENELPAFKEVYLLLVGHERTWSIHNPNLDKNQDPELMIQAISKSDWQGMLNRLITSMRGEL